MTRPGSSVRSIRRTRPLSSAVTIAPTVLAFKSVGDAIGSRVLLGSWMMIVPPVTLIQLVPISLPGWGFGKPRWLSRSVRLGPGEAALAISVLVGLCLILVGLPRGLIWLADWDIAASPRLKRPTSSGGSHGSKAA